jgi:dynein-related subfamily AAA family protein
MNKIPVEINVLELEEILSRYFNADSDLNYAVKINGHPGVGKSAVVKQVAEKYNQLFIDTRLAFKENIDLGGYPVPDEKEKRMLYFRPKFIPPETVPEEYDGIVWFLDEANRAHPTVIQTLFQIITENRCGEHLLPKGTSIVLAGNLGEADNTTITEFDDSALDGRLAIFHLKPDANEWLKWAEREGIHKSVVRYISMFPGRLWDENNINPNPRGWHQVSEAIKNSYNLESEEDLYNFFSDNPGSTLEKVISSLVCSIAGNDFIRQITSPREISTDEIINGNREKLNKLKENNIPIEDLFWAISGAINYFKERNIIRKGKLQKPDLLELNNLLLFISYSRADSRLSFFYSLIRDCGIFIQVTEALRFHEDAGEREFILEKFDGVFGN